MKDVQRYLAGKAEIYAKHPLFVFLGDASIAPRNRLAFMPSLAHFVMTFADLYSIVLREEPARDRFQELVNAHAEEDSGHWKWYLADLANLSLDPVARYSDFLRSVWSDETVKIRTLSYHMCRLALGATPIKKLIVAQCIEAAGRLSLEAVAPVGAEVGKALGRNLVYFGQHHVDTESDHTLEEENVQSWLNEVTLDPGLQSELCEVIDDAFECLTEFADEVRKLAIQPPKLPGTVAG
jgi:hypothetical protein